MANLQEQIQQSPRLVKIKRQAILMFYLLER